MINLKVLLQFWKKIEQDASPELISWWDFETHLLTVWNKMLNSERCVHVYTSGTSFSFVSSGNSTFSEFLELCCHSINCGKEEFMVSLVFFFTVYSNFLKN